MTGLDLIYVVFMFGAIVYIFDRERRDSNMFDEILNLRKQLSKRESTIKFQKDLIKELENDRLQMKKGLKFRTLKWCKNLIFKEKK